MALLSVLFFPIFDCISNRRGTGVCSADKSELHLTMLLVLVFLRRACS